MAKTSDLNPSRNPRLGPHLGRFAMAATLLGGSSLQPAFAQQVADAVLNPVTITATKTPHNVDEVPAHVTVLDNEYIENRNPTKMDDLLRDLPGVEMSGGPRRLGQDVSIRGMGGQRVVTTLDGARQNFNAGHKGRFFLDPDLLRQVEIVRGSNSALHGSGAIGGVIAMETKEAGDFLKAGQTMGFRTKYGYSDGSNENYYSNGVFGRYEDKVDILANYSYRDTNNLKQGDGRELPLSSEDLRDLMFKATLRPAEFHKVSVTALNFKEDGLTLTNPDGTLSATENPAVERLTRMSTYSLNYSYASPDMPLLNPTLKVYRNGLHINERRTPTYRFDTTHLITTGFDVYNTSYFDTGALKHAVTFGSEYYTDTQRATRQNSATAVNGPRQGYPNAESEVAGYYVQDEIEIFHGLTVTPAARFDTYEGRANISRKADEDAFSPKISANWQALQWLSVYGSYGYGFRAPSLLETYVSGSHLGPGNQFVPNPNLRPETTETTEGGFRLKFDDAFTTKDALRFNATYFYTRAEDFIETVVTGTAASGSTTNTNIPNAIIQGAELSAAYDLPYAFSSLGYARIRGENDNTGRPLDSIPADKFTAVLGAKLPEYGVRFGWRGEFVAEQDRVSGVPFVSNTPSSATSKTGGHAVHSIFATWFPLPEYLQGVRVDAGVENIFDTTYRRHLASLYEEGRDYRVSVSYTKGF
ncbi:TonB-dependent hemoglobin/transferrin/lactoferrin family receptor [Ferrovibrio terrae]|uniref:TonB-dependent hemoglobin/transferrin/lactoferrin family receptor n=1 Tax=Ferrovibrio terrae TaxID=2594003 RepID=UPI003137F372